MEENLRRRRRNALEIEHRVHVCELKRGKRNISFAGGRSGQAG